MPVLKHMCPRGTVLVHACRGHVLCTSAVARRLSAWSWLDVKSVLREVESPLREPAIGRSLLHEVRKAEIVRVDRVEDISQISP